MVNSTRARSVLPGLLVLLSACSASVGGADAGPGDGSMATDASDMDGAMEFDSSVGPDGGGVDAGVDAGRVDSGRVDSGRADSGAVDSGVDAGPPPDLSRPERWVRTHPMFISGLIPSMGAPTASFANDYFDAFHANAIHLWQDGLGPELDGWLARRPGAPWVAWTLPDGSSQAGGGLLGGYASAPSGRIGYQVSDEPRTMADLLAMEAGVAAIRARDPEALIIINFGVPADGSGPYEGGDLDAMIDYAASRGMADILEHDNYSRRRSGYAWLERFREAGLRYHLPYWRWIKSYRSGDESWQTESDMRWHALVGLVYGYTGHSWFLYQISAAHSLTGSLFETTGDMSSARSERYAYAATLNQEMTNYGRILTQLTSTDVRYQASVASSAPSHTHLWSAGAGGDTYLRDIGLSGGLLSTEASVGVFRDDAGDHYVMIQNPNHDGASFPLAGHRSIQVRLDFDFASAPAGFDASRVLTFDATTGRAVDMPLTSDGGGRAHAQFDLTAGDVLFYKYATGRGFVGL